MTTGRTGTDTTRRSLPLRLEDAEAELKQAVAHHAVIAEELREMEDRVRLYEQRAIMLEKETRSRIRNLVATVRSIFSRGVATGKSLDDIASHFLGRLNTLARYHGSDPGDHRRLVGVEDMVRGELLEVRAGGDDRIRISGPPIALFGREAEGLALALHELVTNSVKFGVLSTDAISGSISIRWHRAEDRLKFEWAEKGMAIIGIAPLRHGFGREFIEQSLPYELDARTSFELSAGSLVCKIELLHARPGAAA